MSKGAKSVVLQEPPSECKWWWSFLSVVVVAVVMLPLTYTIVDGIVRPLTGLRVASAAGCPTTFGLLLHLVVVFLALRGVMELKL
jgi:hypothetical protein